MLQSATRRRVRTWIVVHQRSVCLPLRRSCLSYPHSASIYWHKWASMSGSDTSRGLRILFHALRTITSATRSRQSCLHHRSSTS